VHELGLGEGEHGSGKLGDKPGGAVVLGSAHSASPITLTLHRISPRRARLTLSLSRVAVRIPYGCQRVPASTSVLVEPFRLGTSLKLSDGHLTRTVSLPAQWSCTRDRGGAVSGMHTVAAPSAALHPGVAVSLTGPRRVIPAPSRCTRSACATNAAGLATATSHRYGTFSCRRA
jgi:hypothetical protein